MPKKPTQIFDLEAERLILAAVLHSGTPMWEQVSHRLTPKHFSLDANRRVWALMDRASKAGLTPDISGCYRQQIDEGKREAGLPLLSEIEQGWIPLTDLSKWVKALQRAAIDRRAAKIYESAAMLTSEGYSQHRETIEASQAELATLEADLADTAPACTIGTMLADVGGLDALMAVPRGMISTPYPSLTRALNGGFRQGEFWILAARPSLGKSTAALEIGYTAALAGHRVQFYSLEMSKRDLLRRLYSRAAEIHFSTIMAGTLSAKERRLVIQVHERMDSTPIEFECKVHGFNEISSRVAQAKAKPALVVIDYLGLVNPGRRLENRNQEISYISRGLKLLATDCEVPILALHQLNRASETEARAPILSDLRDSGSLEQDADGVLFLHVPSRMKKANAAPRSETQLIVSKQRNGPAGMNITLDFEGHFCRFHERIAPERNYQEPRES